MGIVSYFLCRWKGHPAFERRKSLDVLYACGEDGAFAWTCVRCAAKILLPYDTDPSGFSQETIKGLIEAAKDDTGILIGGVEDDCPMR